MELIHSVLLLSIKKYEIFKSIQIGFNCSLNIASSRYEGFDGA